MSVGTLKSYDTSPGTQEAGHIPLACTGKTPKGPKLSAVVYFEAPCKQK